MVYIPTNVRGESSVNGDTCWIRLCKVATKIKMTDNDCMERQDIGFITSHGLTNTLHEFRKRWRMHFLIVQLVRPSGVVTKSIGFEPRRMRPDFLNDICDFCFVFVDWSHSLLHHALNTL